ncbi:MAG: hypothetical protein JXR66_00245 [Bacteroidales bacterium]|nr:hypothetical protein [Bacteroidales bacterium]
MTVTPQISRNNFYAFLWHAGFLAFAKNFMDVDTIIPAMIIESGGGSVHIGIMTVIILGGSRFTQLFFAPFISNWAFKKKFMLLGINLRIVSLFALGFMLVCLRGKTGADLLLWFIFIFITIFSVGGAFTNIGYTDILGKSVNENKRKSFFSAKQIIAGLVLIVSAFAAKQILVKTEYPVNYAWLFVCGAVLLLVASAGFWKIKEAVPSFMNISGFKDFLKKLKSELARNSKLVSYLGYINTQGIIVSFLPFVMLYAKETYFTQSSDTGNFLLYKVIGIVAVSMVVLLASTKIKYNFLLYLNVFLSVILILATLYINNESLLVLIFILGGLVITLYNITMNGLLLEVSDRSNRALYTGFSGAGHILPTLFPLTGSWIINSWGFRPFFMLFIAIILSSLFFIRKINCDK